MKRSDDLCGCGNSNQRLSSKMNDPVSGHNAKSVNSVPLPTSEHFVIGIVQTSEGQIPQVSTRLNWKDYRGAFKVRWGIRRDSYRVDPGLYAAGAPDERSDVLVTANYKLTFDIVRKNLEGLDVWLLVLDTKGVNVWCAAGKGTFGTNELVRRIQLTSLDKVVIHRRLILPQLGAVGVAAHLVKEISGFTVIYGPVRVADVRTFIHIGYKATKDMRRVTFDWYDRLKLVPNDLVYNLRYLGATFIVFFILSGINADGFLIRQAMRNIVPFAKFIFAGYLAGIVLTPLFLPIIPSRNFAIKGLMMGFMVSGLLFLNHSLRDNLLAGLVGVLLLTSVSSFLAMNCTGASTFTSLAGVKKEMRIAVPVQICLASLAIVIVIVRNFI